MKRSFGATAFFAVVLAVACTAPAFAQQQFINEDFSSAAGLNPPAGWSVIQLLGLPGQGWRFDNPDSRTIIAPLMAPVAIVDSDNAGVVPIDSILRSPSFSAVGAAQVLLDFDQHHQPLGSQTDVIVVSGGTQTIVYTNTAGTPNPDHQTIDITAACGGNNNCQIRWRHQANFDWWQMVDNVMVTEPSPVDVGITALLSPTAGVGGCNQLGNAETITVEITNSGTAILPIGLMIPVAYDVNLSGVVNETLTLGAPLNPGTATSYSFATTADLTGAGLQQIDTATALVGDGNPTNDLNTFMVGSTPVVSLFPFTENFDTHGFVNLGTVVPPNWINVQGENAGGGDSDWESLSGPTGSFNTGPSADHTTGAGFYFYTEDSGGNHAAVELDTPCLSLVGLAMPRLSFWLHHRDASGGTTPNSFSVDVVTYPGAIVVPDVFGPQAPLGVGDMWVKQNIDLSIFAGGTIRCRFRSRSDGGSFTNDIAIDDVAFVDFIPGPGQAPQPGIAVMDINNSVTNTADNVASGVNGPYFAQATVGGAMNFSFEGTSNQPFLLLSGPLNPAVLSFPPIGQLDIGNPDGMGGVMNVVIVADGSNPMGSFLDSLFRMKNDGTQQMSFLAPGGLMGATIDFQCVMFGGPFGVGISNAVELAIM